MIKLERDGLVYANWISQRGKGLMLYLAAVVFFVFNHVLASLPFYFLVPRQFHGTRIWNSSKTLLESLSKVS